MDWSWSLFLNFSCLQSEFQRKRDCLPLWSSPSEVLWKKRGLSNNYPTSNRKFRIVCRKLEQKKKRQTVNSYFTESVLLLFQDVILFVAYCLQFRHQQVQVICKRQLHAAVLTRCIAYKFAAFAYRRNVNICSSQLPVYAP